MFPTNLLVSKAKFDISTLQFIDFSPNLVQSIVSFISVFEL